jgi:nitrogen fixation/metabolism regulation signal transduction histidine kinase
VIERQKTGSPSIISLFTIALLYFLLIILILFFSRQVLQDLAAGETLTRLIFIPLGIVLPVFLVLSFAYQLFRLFKDVRAQKPGSRFKMSLTGFFLFITLTASIPQGVLTITFISSSLEAWFNTEMEDALEGGLSITLRYNNETVRQLESISTSGILADLLLKEKGEGRPELWNSLRSVYPKLTSLQLFDGEGVSYAFYGNPVTMLENAPPDGPEGAVSRTHGDQDTFLRASRRFPLPEENGFLYGMAVLSVMLPENFEKDGRALTDAIQVFGQYRTYRSSFALALVLLYALFAIPLLLISLLVAFHTGSEIVKPIVHLEEAMRRVMEGDYSIRILSEGRDELSILVRSFNEMVSELEFSRAKILQTEKVTAWQEIAQRMAHEIKNPLTPIQLSAERILRAYKTGPDQLERVVERSVASIVLEVENLTNMLQEFRDFARLPAPRPTGINLKRLIREVASSYAQGYPKVAVDDSLVDPEISISADLAQIKRVFSNLMKNSFEAVAPRENGKIVVRSDLVRKGNTHYCRIHIEDNGNGIPEELRDKVFQPYITTKKSGTGLGLPIVERIVADHHGRIWFETEIETGTTFIVDLPAETAT